VIGIAQIVQHHHTVAFVQKLQTGMRTDISGTAGDQYIHNETSHLFFFILHIFPQKSKGLADISVAIFEDFSIMKG
jgi:hypothetical protein